jgi:hypothetical protein
MWLGWGNEEWTQNFDIETSSKTATCKTEAMEE